MIKETKNRYDIIVVGGGFAGLCAAIEAAKDANVLVLERKKEIGVPVNTVGAVHHKVIGKFGLEKFVDNYISGYRVHYPDGSEVTLKSKNFMGIMDVEAMLKELSQRAENQGA
ncbi:MAG: FAD-dependent oxidoreductase, partial [Candidatus Methanofastidiosia archaeon]